MYDEMYINLADVMRKTIASLTTLQTETMQMCLDATADSMQKTLRVMASSCYPSKTALNEIATLMSDLYNAMFPSISTIGTPPISSDNFNFLNEIDFQDEYVELTEEECDSINDLIEKSDVTDIPTVVPQKKYLSIELIIAIFSLILNLYSTFGTTPFQKELLEKMNTICELLNESQSSSSQSAPEPDLSNQESDCEAPDFYKT